MFFMSNPQANQLPSLLPQSLPGSNGPRLDISNLYSAVSYYYSRGLANSTMRSYQAGQKHYLSFCSAAQRPAIPTSEEMLMMFASYLAKGGLSHQTIKVYLSAVRNLHETKGQHSDYTAALTLCLKIVLKGIKK